MSERRCPRCGRSLPLEAFDYRDAERTRLQSYCRECAKSARREWYAKEESREKHYRLVRERRRARIDRHRTIILQFKSRPCEDCGEAFPPEAMDFDHIAEKRIEVSRLLYISGTEALLAEIKKCEVVCANGHRIRTKRRLIERRAAREHEQGLG